jgi:hypothetical protein
MELHPSKAADTGTVIPGRLGTGMYYLNRIVNQLSGAIKISASMAAVEIQGMPAELCSDSFRVAYVSADIVYTIVRPRLSARETLSTNSTMSTPTIQSWDKRTKKPPVTKISSAMTTKAAQTSKKETI